MRYSKLLFLMLGLSSLANAGDVEREYEIVNARVGLREVVAAGQTVWNLIQENAPSAEFRSAKAHALPPGFSTPDELEGWKGPTLRRDRVQFKLPGGIRFADFTYEIQFSYGGNFGGEGKYLANLIVVPKDVWVAVGYRLDVSVEILDPVNVGTAAKRVAGRQVIVHWKINGPAYHEQESATYLVRGDGSVHAISR